MVEFKFIPYLNPDLEEGAIKKADFNDKRMMKRTAPSPCTMHRVRGNWHSLPREKSIFGTCPGTEALQDPRPAEENTGAVHKGPVSGSGSDCFKISEVCYRILKMT